MREKNIIITGATDGIGKATARRLGQAADGSVPTNIWLVGRNPQKTEQVLKELRQACPHAHLDGFIADLSSQRQVQRLATQIFARMDHVDVLINNAGGLFQDKRTTIDGFELTFALNHLSPFHLTNRLLPLLHAAEKARIIVVSSNAHAGPGLDFNNLQGEKSYGGMRNYHISKLANVLFTRELARRLHGSSITVNCLHPGWVHSNISSTFPAWQRFFFEPLSRMFALSADRGADTTVYLATSAEVAKVSGRYFYKCREAKSSRASLDGSAGIILWKASEALLHQYLGATHLLPAVKPEEDVSGLQVVRTAG